MATLGSSSPARVSSSPVPDSLLASTPPSSPALSSDSPIFKTESSSIPVLPLSRVPNAFSVLGKRKTPLSESNCNARPLKKLATVKSTKRNSAISTQMQLSLGQKVEVRCKECGMLYVASMEEDRRLHDKFHKSANEGVGVGAVLASKRKNHLEGHTARTICVVEKSDPAWMRSHVRKVLDVMTSCLGAVEIPDKELWSKDASQHEMWMYIEEERCVAAMLVKRDLRAARRVVSPPACRQPQVESALEKLKRRRAEMKAAQDAPLRIAERTQAANVGISRIWTAPASRGKGYAKTLLDAMFQTIQTASSGDLPHKIDAVAFSQPTTAGTRLARRWFGRPYGWLVYSDE